MTTRVVDFQGQGMAGVVEDEGAGERGRVFAGGAFDDEEGAVCGRGVHGVESEAGVRGGVLCLSLGTEGNQGERQGLNDETRHGHRIAAVRWRGQGEVRERE